MGSSSPLRDRAGRRPIGEFAALSDAASASSAAADPVSAAAIRLGLGEIRQSVCTNLLASAASMLAVTETLLSEPTSPLGLRQGAKSRHALVPDRRPFGR